MLKLSIKDDNEIGSKKFKSNIFQSLNISMPTADATTSTVSNPNI